MLGQTARAGAVESRHDATNSYQCKFVADRGCANRTTGRSIGAYAVGHLAPSNAAVRRYPYSAMFRFTGRAARPFKGKGNGFAREWCSSAHCAAGLAVGAPRPGTSALVRNCDSRREPWEQKSSFLPASVPQAPGPDNIGDARRATH
ncbi:hypothetical protein EVAR_12496_1 [Eumeta japonica]|uniref:Uncharacterized protein n=1 Tax=Eumeta variegata TaxID=151549 RepID=A0A4C1TPL0_EUMVA|nr:hypothetical protein EVAR_12496_1 [Eumeta japonica]